VHHPSHLRIEHRGGDTIGIDRVAKNLAKRLDRAQVADIDSVVVGRSIGHTTNLFLNFLKKRN
jgi:hypothetical protein